MRNALNNVTWGLFIGFVVLVTAAVITAIIVAIALSFELVYQYFGEGGLAIYVIFSGAVVVISAFLALDV